MTTRAKPEIAVAGQELVPDSEPKWTALGRYGRVNLAVTLLQAGGWFLLLGVIDD